ncbi:hypothetical protein [Nocardia carnea]|uniref:hypothetical protein n=1 Tax=Nocardia carnea TaxID=37328 RepID=UPI002457D29E|nr:hypothetical protein [Nocardia carnea]
MRIRRPSHHALGIAHRGGGRRRIVIDLPYDEGPRTPIEDANRMRGLRERQQDNPARTVAWLPTHLSEKRRADFGRLVVIDKALADERRFDTQYAQHLNADNRAAAKQLLQSQHETLRGQLKAAFEQAYGLAEKIDVTTEIEQHFHPLPEAEGLTLPIGQSMREGIRDIARKLMAHQFPDHPDLDPERTCSAVRAADTKTVLTQSRSAAESRDGRVEVPAKDRALMRRLATAPSATGYVPKNGTGSLRSTQPPPPSCEISSPTVTSTRTAGYCISGLPPRNASAPGTS